MRKCFLPLIVLLFATATKAQYVNIPDSNFRNYLMAISPNCFNATKQLDTTCADLLLWDTLVFDGGWSNNLDSIRNIDGIQYYKSLKMLLCNGHLGQRSSINYIPKLPNSLKHFTCSFNQITSLPKFPDSLENLDCWVNNIDSLPDLPPTLRHIQCSENKIKKIPTIPNSLATLWCAENLLDSLPKLNFTLLDLSCSSNNISTLPQLPNTLQILQVYGNKLSNLPTLPDSLIEINCSSNNIFCLPKLPKTLQIIRFDTAKIRCIPNSVAGFNYPICNAINNVNGCASIYPSISGRIYFDTNSNGIKDNAEVYVNNLKMNLSNNSYTFTNDSGYYYLAPDTIGNFIVSAQTLSYTNTIPATTSYTFTKYDTSIIQNVAIQPIVFKDSLHATLTSINRARIGGQFFCQVDVKNAGTTNLTNVSSIISYDTSKLIFDTLRSYPFTHSNGNLVVNFSNFPFFCHYNYTIYFRVKPTTTLGDTIKMISTITDGSLVSTDSSFNKIISSFDPNDKQATPELSTTQVAEGKRIDYTIRFQNTGNDTAFHVVIADTLDSKLNFNSLQMIATSHLCKTTIKDNIIFFEMRDIMLPDSNVNKLGSNGFIRFSMQPKNTVVAGNNIPNKAAIYFDYNAPVITNTAITQIKNPILPVKIVRYEVRCTNEGAQFPSIGGVRGGSIENSWTTASEINTSHFIVQRSEDGRVYKSVGKVAAKGFGSYSFIDPLTTNNLPLTIYYRLQAVDKDGSYQFSEVKQIRLNDKLQTINVYPNPTKSIVTIDCKDAKELFIIDYLGKTIKQFNNVTERQIINIKQFSKGIYVVKMLMNNGEIKAEKLVVE